MSNSLKNAKTKGIFTIDPSKVPQYDGTVGFLFQIYVYLLKPPYNIIF